MHESSTWPNLSIADWKDTCATLHLWTQIVGKIRTAQMPWTNHSWHVTLYVTPRGLTTLAMPCQGGSFQIDFDFVDHQLVLESSKGAIETIALEPMTVADFYHRVSDVLKRMDIEIDFHGTPNEVDPAIPFAQDTEHHSYDSGSVDRFRQALLLSDQVMKVFRARFIGKCSPVHFFWGSFDLAVTRFSGRPAPEHPGGFPNMPDWITREAYSHEVSSCGFWPGGNGQEAMFYAYASPAPDGFDKQPVQPEAASYSNEMGEFVLPYEAIRQSSQPEVDLLAFFQSSYEAAAETGNWDRESLEWNGPKRS